jgi:hypothetical protein
MKRAKNLKVPDFGLPATRIGNDVINLEKGSALTPRMLAFVVGVLKNMPPHR